MIVRTELLATLAAIRAVTPLTPRVGLVLGSGFGQLSDRVEGVRIPFSDLPGFARATSHSHAGELVIGTLDGVEIAVLNGRLHLYEGHSPAEVAFPVRVLAALGGERLILTNAAGGLAPDLIVGDVVVIEDHLSLASLIGRDPVAGVWQPEDGERFVSLNGAYSKRLIAAALSCAKQAGLTARTGVYAFVNGPAIETPAEVRALRMLGGDVVGMSTVPEVIAARQCGVEVCAVSAVTNLAVDSVDSAHVTTADEVYAAEALRPALSDMIARLIGARPFQTREHVPP